MKTKPKVTRDKRNNPEITVPTSVTVSRMDNNIAGFHEQIGEGNLEGRKFTLSRAVAGCGFYVHFEQTPEHEYKCFAIDPMQLIGDALKAALNDLEGAKKMPPPAEATPETRRSVDEVEGGN